VGYPEIAQIFWVPPIISGTGKATNFKFCMHIHSINRKKSPLKISEKVPVDVVGDNRKFSVYNKSALKIAAFFFK